MIRFRREGEVGWMVPTNGKRPRGSYVSGMQHRRGRRSRRFFWSVWWGTGIRVNNYSHARLPWFDRSGASQSSVQKKKTKAVTAGRVCGPMEMRHGRRVYRAKQRSESQWCGWAIPRCERGRWRFFVESSDLQRILVWGTYYCIIRI
jgi:hypothetical protein